MKAHLPPVEMAQERRKDIGEKDEREIFQILGVVRIGGEYLKEQAHARENGDKEDGIEGGREQLHPLGHRAEVGADIERVRGEKKGGRDIEERPGIVPADVRGKPVPAHDPDARTHLLYDRHQGERKRREP